MKRLFVFFIVLMTFTLAWPHAPPVVMDPGITVEFLADNLDLDYDLITVDDAIQTVDILQIELPYEFYDPSFPVLSVITDPGTQGVNLYARIDATQEKHWLNNNLMWFECSDDTFTNSTYRLNLAKYESMTVVGPSRLDIGEFLSVFLTT